MVDPVQLARDTSLDPYFAWARATGFAATLGQPAASRRVAFQFEGAEQKSRFIEARESLGVQLAPHYEAVIETEDCRFVCADVPLATLPQAATLAKRVRVGLIGNAEQRQQAVPGERVSVADLGSPLTRAQAVRRMRQAQMNGEATPLDRLGFFKQVKATKRRAPLLSKQVSQQDGRPMIAVIDFGCAFAHPKLRRAGEELRSRVVNLWDQGRAVESGWHPEMSATWPWKPEKRFGYGREATGTSLDALMADVREAAPPRSKEAEWKGQWDARLEEAVYLAAGLPELLEPSTHGTAVLGMAAAWPHPLIPSDGEPDAAGQADLIFVQLPPAAIDDLSGGWVTTYVLDAVHYAIEKAGGRPLVINLSIGSHAGSHDGDSLLEAAFENLLSIHADKLAIVLAAGNAAGKKGHARAVLDPQASGEVVWAVPEGDPTQSFLEFWYPMAPGDKSPEFELSGPGGVTLSSKATPPLTCDAAGRPFVALLQTAPPSGEAGSGMTLVALGPTQASDRSARGMGVAPCGRWTVRVNSASAKPLDVQAWIERDEPGAAPPTDRPDSIVKPVKDGGPFQVTDDGTMTGQATGSSTWVVGGYELDRPRPKPSPKVWPEPSRESGRGGTRGRRKDIDVLAPSDQWADGRTRGLPVLANRSPVPQAPLPGVSADGHARLAGTSLAAPWVVRALCNLAAGGYSLNDRTALFKGMTQVQPRIERVATAPRKVKVRTAATVRSTR